MRVWRPMAKKSKLIDAPIDIPQQISDFLLMVNSSYGHITYRLRDIFAYRGWRSRLFHTLYFDCRFLVEERPAISRDVARHFSLGGLSPWRARGARAYNGGLGAEPPAGSRGRAPGQGVWGAKSPRSWCLFRRCTSIGIGKLALMSCYEQIVILVYLPYLHS